jgi:hypothetical protein
MRADRLKRLGDRRFRRKLAAIDTALEFGERHHWHRFLKERPARFYEAGRDGASAPPVIPGRA